MKYLSVCSGIEAASVAWHPLGWQPVAFSEIEPFPCAVLAHHYPHVPNLGDMTKFKDWPDAAIDLLVGGTPCQSFSVAGLRKGLADPRGNLALVYLAIADRYRPEWIVWENVPGVLSSSGGRDFGAFLGGLVELGYGFAYRVLDAQYVRVDGFGRAVPQRRRRVFVVGNSRDWRRAAAVLFERESLSWNHAPSRQAGQGFAQDVAPSLVSSGRGTERIGETRGQDPVIAIPSTGDVSHCLNAGGMGRQDYETETETVIVSHALRADGFDASEDGTGRGTPLVPVVTASLTRGAESSGKGYAGRRQEDDVNLVAFAHQQGGSSALHYGKDVAITLQKSQEQAVAFDLRGREGGSQFEGPHDTANIRAASGGSSRSYVVGTAHASPSEANTGTLLRRVRDALGEEAFTEWGLGILGSLQPAEVLRSVLHGSELRPASFSRRWVVYCALSRKEDRAEGALQSLREARGQRRASSGWQSSKQFAGELGAYLSELSQPGAQSERFMQDLWAASEGLGVLRKALSAIQKARRPANGEGEPTQPAWAVRRLMPEECEFLQGFPRGYTDITFRNKPAADGPRYKALGNSFAVNVVRWIGRRIELVNSLRLAA